MTISTQYFSAIALTILCSAALAGNQPPPTFPTEAATLTAIQALAQIQKDKFENSSEFNKRLCSGLDKAINAAPGTVVSFRVFSSSVFYNADKQVFEFNVLDGSSTTSFYPSLNKYFGIRIASSGKVKGAYVGQNAFGASKSISATEEDDVTLLLPVKKNGTAWAAAKKLAARPAEARSLDNDLGIIISTKIQPPCFVKDTKHITPQFDYPIDVRYTINGIVGSKDATWKIIRNSTNETLKSGGF